MNLLPFIENSHLLVYSYRIEKIPEFVSLFHSLAYVEVMSQRGYATFKAGQCSSRRMLLVCLHDKSGNSAHRSMPKWQFSETSARGFKQFCALPPKCVFISLYTSTPGSVSAQHLLQYFEFILFIFCFIFFSWCTFYVQSQSYHFSCALPLFSPAFRPYFLIKIHIKATRASGSRIFTSNISFCSCCLEQHSLLFRSVAQSCREVCPKCVFDKTYHVLENYISEYWRDVSSVIGQGTKRSWYTGKGMQCDDAQESPNLKWVGLD